MATRQKKNKNKNPEKGKTEEDENAVSLANDLMVTTKRWVAWQRKMNSKQTFQGGLVNSWLLRERGRERECFWSESNSDFPCFPLNQSMQRCKVATFSCTLSALLIFCSVCIVFWAFSKLWKNFSFLFFIKYGPLSLQETLWFKSV